MSDPIPVCGFCGRVSELMISGPGVYACKDCVGKAKEVITRTQETLYRCKFCGETVPIDSVVVGPEGLNMCIGCVDSGLKLLNK